MPFRYKVRFATGLNSKYGIQNGEEEILSYAVNSINLPKMEGQAAEGSLYLGNTIFTIPVWNIASRKLDITFEETDNMLVSRFVDALNTLSYGKVPWKITIIVYEFEEHMRDFDKKDGIEAKVTAYVCHMNSYDEPQFKRDGAAAQLTMSTSFIVDSIIENWNDSMGTITGKIFETSAEFNPALDTLQHSVQEDQFTMGDVMFDAGPAANGGTKSIYVPPGKKVAGKGGTGKSDLKTIQAAGAAEIYGTNGMGRKEGSKNLVYFNSKDEGAQAGKLNFGAGNTQVFLEGTEMKNVKITITNKKTGETLTGTMDELTKKLSGRNDANSSKSAWEMDAASAQKVEDIALGKVSKAVQTNVDSEIIKAMDTDTLGGLFHQEYGAGGSTKATGKWLKEHKEEALADLKRNNGKFSEEFGEKMAKGLGKNMRKETKNSYVDRTRYFTGVTGYAVSHKKG